MKDRHYVLVVMDSSGGETRRVCVRRRSIVVAISLAVAALLTCGAIATHASFLYDVATESTTMSHESAELARVVGELEQRLPAARLLVLRAELAFAQLWTKSGLGVEARLLGMGPLEESIQQPGSNDNLSPFRSGHILELDPLAMPFEFDRLESDARALQGRLAETLEYFHDAERLLSNTPSIKPAKTPWVTSGFGRRRHPISHYWVMHKGLDLGGYVGMHVMAPADGVVIWTGRRGSYGKTVVIDHGFGMQTHYAHLSRFLVRRGQRVKRGEVFAEMGNTGVSTGPHLHYEVRRNGRPLDPGKFILD